MPMENDNFLVQNIDIRAVREQLKILGHNVPDDVVVSFLQGLDLGETAADAGGHGALDDARLPSLSGSQGDGAGDHWAAAGTSSSGARGLAAQGVQQQNQQRREEAPFSQQGLHTQSDPYNSAPGSSAYTQQQHLGQLRAPGGFSSRPVEQRSRPAALQPLHEQLLRDGRADDASPKSSVDQCGKGSAGKFKALLKPAATGAAAAAAAGEASAAAEKNAPAEVPAAAGSLDQRCRSFLSRLTDSAAAGGQTHTPHLTPQKSFSTSARAAAMSRAQQQQQQQQGQQQQEEGRQGSGHAVPCRSIAAWAASHGVVSGSPLSSISSLSDGDYTDDDEQLLQQQQQQEQRHRWQQQAAQEEVIVLRDLVPPTEQHQHGSSTAARGMADTDEDWAAEAAHATAARYGLPMDSTNHSAFSASMHDDEGMPAAAAAAAAAQAQALLLRSGALHGSSSTLAANRPAGLPLEASCDSIIGGAAAGGASWTPGRRALQGGARRVSGDQAALDPLYLAPSSPGSASKVPLPGSCSPYTLSRSPLPLSGPSAAAARNRRTSAPAPVTAAGIQQQQRGQQRPVSAATAAAGARGGPMARQQQGLAERQQGLGGSRSFAGPSALWGSSSSSGGSSSGTRKVDRVARYQQLQQQWRKDKFLRSGGAGVPGADPRPPQNFAAYYAALHSTGTQAGPRGSKEGRGRTAF